MSKDDVLRELEGFMAEKRSQIKAGYFPEQAQDDIDILDKIYEYVKIIKEEE